MLLPLGTDRPLKRTPRVTPALIVLCCLAFLVEVLVERFGGGIDFDALALSFNVVGYDEVRNAWIALPDGWPLFRIWQPITYQFLHGDWLHLIGNMLFLWVFGQAVEDRLGRIGFLLLFLLGGVAAAGAHAVFAGMPGVTVFGEQVTAINGAVGASGSIAAVTGAFLVLFPRAGIKCFVFFFIIGMIVLPAWVWVVMSVVFDMVFLGFSNDNVAREAHLGGYAFGFVVAAGLLWARVIKPEPMYDLISIHRHAKRRREFKELVHREGSAWHKDPSRKLIRNEKKQVPEDPAADEIAERKKQIRELLAEGETERAADAYLELVSEHREATLPRDEQLTIGNHLFSADRHSDAADAYERFLEAYPSDAESPRLRVMLALLAARYLNDPVRARELLAEVERRGTPPGLGELVRTLSEELG